MNENIRKLPENIRKIIDNIMRMRIVSTPNQFREKVIIAENGLNDRTVELLKMIYLSQLPAIFADDETEDKNVTEILFDVSEEGIMYFCIFFEGDIVRNLAVDRSVYDKVSSDFKNEVSSEKKEFETVDVQWAKKIFQNWEAARKE